MTSDLEKAVAWAKEMLTDSEYTAKHCVPEVANDYRTQATHLRALVAAAEDAARWRFLRDNANNQLYLTRNEHACNYCTAKDWIEREHAEWFANDPPAEIQRMKEADTIWTLQIYPRTPTGFDAWNGATPEAVVDAAIDALRGKEGG